LPPRFSEAFRILDLRGRPAFFNTFGGLILFIVIILLLFGFFVIFNDFSFLNGFLKFW
jgi:hypothetical protein